MRGPGAFYAAPMGSAFVDEAARLGVFHGDWRSRRSSGTSTASRLDGSGMKRLTPRGRHPPRHASSPTGASTSTRIRATRRCRRSRSTTRTAACDRPRASAHRAPGALRVCPTPELRTIPAARRLPAAGPDPQAARLRRRRSAIPSSCGSTADRECRLVKDEWDRATPSSISSWRSAATSSPRSTTAAPPAASKTHREHSSLRRPLGRASGRRPPRRRALAEGAAVGRSREGRHLGPQRRRIFHARALTRVEGVSGRDLDRARHRLALLRQQVDRGLHEDCPRRTRRATTRT